jgi:tetratricopeptide (TPR) repeat protein
MSKYTRKQRIKAEDEFVSFWHHAYDKLSPYGRAIGITLATALAMWFLIWGVSGYFERRTQSAAEAFGRAVKIYDAELVTDDNPVKSDEENPVPRFKTAKERADATLAELDGIDKTYGKSEIAQNALLFRAGVLFDLGRYDEALAANRKFLEFARDRVPASTLARENLGLCYEALGKLDEALAAYEALEPKHGDFYRDRALYAEARVLAKKGDKKKAAERYQQALKVPSTPLRDEIQARLASLEAQ